MTSPDYQLTTPSGLRALKGDSLISDIDAGFLALAQDLENKFRPPVGAMSQYAGSADPVDGDGTTRWLICDGRAISRTTYAALFAVVASTYGAGDGSTTFNIPDLRGRVPVGADSGGAHLPTNHPARGATGGEESHVLSGTEMPSHTHTGPGHTHSFAGGENVPVSTNAFGLLSETASGGSFVVSASGSLGNITATDASGSGATGSAGGGATHNNMQPYLAVNHIIKVL